MAPTLLPATPGASATPYVVFVRLPIRIQSEANLREHFRVVAKRKAEQKFVVAAALAAQWARVKIDPPLIVTLTRIGPRLLDDDNLASGFKATRDSVAKVVGIDDGDRARIRWRYRDRKSVRGDPHRYACEIRIERALVG